MKIPSSAHRSQPWRIHEIAADFELLDVWALPTPGGPDDFPALLDLVAAGDLSSGGSRAARALFAIRWKLGELFGWDDQDPKPGTTTQTLRNRLPADLVETAADASINTAPFSALYVTANECAAEIVNRTVHGVLHLGWVEVSPGSYRGQMAILVKPNGRLGRLYLAGIAPFRYLVVYPAMMRQIGRAWERRPESREPSRA